MANPLDLFAVTAPGLEPICAAEVAELGVAGEIEPGGVGWAGNAAQLYAANLRLRTASRVLVRVAEFTARSFRELERHADRVPWERYLTPGAAVGLRVTARKSKLYHQRAIEQRVREAIARQLGTVEMAADTGDDDVDDAAAEAASPQLFVVRFFRDHCTISADSSGALLHRRGYRQAVAKAPLRETIAAAMLLASGWDRRSPLLDPFCGAGTIPIEAALLARGIAPGLATGTPRAYSFQQWPGFDAVLWNEVIEGAAAEILPASPAPVFGSDRDAGAIEATAANAGRARVTGDLQLDVRAFSNIESPGNSGWLVTNPPYGVRTGEKKALRNLHAALGRVMRDKLPAWNVAILSADDALERQTGLSLAEGFRTRNGGIPVRLLQRTPPVDGG